MVWRIFGWEARPRVAGTLPGLAIFPGYSGAPMVPRAWARVGFVALQISPRGHHMSDQVYAPGFPGLMTAGLENPREYAYRGVYCDVWRALESLADLPGVDPERIVNMGGSQGGGVAIVGATGRYRSGRSRPMFPISRRCATCWSWAVRTRMRKCETTCAFNRGQGSAF